VDLSERKLSSESVYEGHFLHVRRDQIALPDSSTASREYIVHPGAVVVVPILDFVQNDVNGVCDSYYPRIMVIFL
jgi:ADP-ribose pyrophosphatase